MADNVAVTAGSGTTIAADEVTDGTLGSCKVQFVKLMDGTLDGTSKATVGANGLSVDVSASTGVGSLTETAPATDTASSGLNGRLQRIAQRITSLIALLPSSIGGKNKAGSLSVTLATDQVGTAGTAASDVVTVQGIASMTALKVDGSAVNQPTLGFQTTIKSTVTRPADTTAYAANDCISDSTSAPTSGGFTVTGAGRASGGSGIITDVVVTSSADPATTLQGEIWVYDQAATNTNDNAAFNPNVADRLNLVGVIPFTLASVQGGSGSDGSFAVVSGLNLGFTCSGSANLRYLLKAKNAYTPISAEVFQIAWKIVQTN